ARCTSQEARHHKDLALPMQAIMPASPRKILHKSVCIFLCNSLHHHIAILFTVILHYTLGLTILKTLQLQQVTVGIIVFLLEILIRR
ncbi:hypothetical protein, partial [Sporosarcina sp. E16_8]|uniref:hypothetical protein n=1 Tax=Sporosarcina sp. E16_8 TaxID=2789295 RepID=UPI001A92A6E0